MNAATISLLDHAKAEFVPPPGAEYPSYAQRRRPNWIALAAIAGMHVAALVALLTLDVVHVSRSVSRPTVLTLIPEMAPPPPALPPPTPAPDLAKPPPVVVPVPEVKVATPSVAIAVTTVVPPPAPAPAPAAVASPAPPAPVAAPITPPSATAATLDNPAPRYPVDARRRHQEGTVRLRVVITVEGRVKEIAVAKSSGVDSLDEAALAAVKRWRFVPGMQAGQPVEAIGFVPIPFRLTA